MADVPFMDEERHGEQARQDALWTLRGQPIAPLPLDREVSPEEAVSARFSKSPFGYIDRGLKAGTDWIKGRMAKRKAPFEKAGLTPTPIDPVELVGTMLTEGGRTANRWLAAAGGHGPMLRDEDLLGPLGAGGMTAPFAVRAGAHLGSAGGKLPTAPFQRQVDDLGYYSKLDEVLGTLRPTDTVTMDTLAKRGVKAAEIEARGLSPFMAEGRGAKVGDLQGSAQPVRVLESRYAEPSDADYAAYAKKHGLEHPPGRFSGVAEDAGYAGEPKWKDYATDGDNPSYHEGVLHLPEPSDAAFLWNNEMAAKYGRDWQKPGVISPEDAARGQELHKAASAAPSPFKSGHWSEPNAIAHYRASMQPTEGGGKAYLIDELQSDWGQKIRDGGARDEAKIAELRRRKEENELRTKALVDEGRDPKTNRLMREQEWLDARKEHDLIDAELRTAEAATPANPFVNTTEQWMTTALRRIMRNAAEQQADGIAITPGAVHNERFGLDKAVKRLYLQNPVYGEDGKIVRGDFIATGHNGGDLAAERGVGPERIRELIGGDYTDRLLAEPSLELSGDGLRMGGEGMKYAYDKILPKLLGKELSRLDPSIKYGQRKVAPHDWDGPLDPASFEGKPLSDQPFYENPFHHFPLTPKAREEIMKGLPLFNMPGGPEAIAEALRTQQQLQSPFTQDE